MRLPNNEPILRMPIPSGAVVLCQQGNQSPKTFSHSDAAGSYALDFSNIAIQDLEIVAAARGTVRDRTEGNLSESACGADTSWFGNYVLLDHGRNFFTIYGHLKEINVALGAPVGEGEQIGIMGDTGRAGNVHLHFALLYQPFSEKPKDVIDFISVPIHALITADMSSSGRFKLFSSLEMIGAKAAVSLEGHIYGSENSIGRELLFGDPPLELLKELHNSSNDLIGSIESHHETRDEEFQAKYANALTYELLVRDATIALGHILIQKRTGMEETLQGTVKAVEYEALSEETIREVRSRVGSGKVPLDRIETCIKDVFFKALRESMNNNLCSLVEDEFSGMMNRRLKELKTMPLVQI
jgi:hypothetical protein